MAQIGKVEGFVSSNFNLMRNLSLFALLCALEAYLGSKFTRPSHYQVKLVYSHAFFFLPAVMLTVVGFMFTRRYSRGILCRKCCSSKYFLLVLLEVGKAPLLWILILLVDGRYLTCFLFGAFPSLGYYGNNVEPYGQVAGLLGLTLYVVVTCFITRGNSKSNFMTYWYHKQHERCLLQEVEKALQEKVEEKTRIMVEELVSKDFDKLNPKNGDTMAKLEELLLEYKDQVNKLLTEEPEVKDVETAQQE